MKRKALAVLISELQDLAALEDVTVFKQKRNELLARAVPVLAATSRTRPLAEVLKRSLTEFQRYVPTEEEGDAASRAEARFGAWLDRRASVDRLICECRRAMRVNRLALVCGGVGLLVGCLAVGLVISRMRVVAASADWSVTNGRLLSVQIHKRTGSTRAGRIGTWIDNPTWGLTVVYDYLVNGVAYHGNRFSFEPDSNDHDYWVTKARRYRGMGEVSVHYDPADPAQAVLETNAHPSSFLVFLVMGLALACGGGFLLVKEWFFRCGRQ